MATQTFTIHTENPEQTNALKAFVKALKMKFEVSKTETNASDWWDEIGTESKASIERGLDDLNNGRVHNDQDVRNSVRERILKSQRK